MKVGSIRSMMLLSNDAFCKRPQWSITKCNIMWLKFPTVTVLEKGYGISNLCSKIRNATLGVDDANIHLTANSNRYLLDSCDQGRLDRSIDW